MPPANPLILYEEIYKCMDCASAVSDESVRSFVQTGPGQTIPVSHFGDIRSSKIWLVSTNPKGNRHDSNVSYLPPGFVSRAALRPDQVQQVFGHFSAYFNRQGYDSFFDRWIQILGGIELGGLSQTWQGGGICCVDLIKCPTRADWRGVVRGPDKNLIYGCFRNSGSRKYLKRQIDLHDPRVLIFSASLGGPAYYAENNRSNLNSNLRRLWPADMKTNCTGIWTAGSPSRLSMGLTAEKTVRPDKIKNAIQTVIRAWEATSHGV